MPYRLPSFFVSHGTPMHAFGEDSFEASLQKFATTFQKPKAIIVVSAHSVSSDQIQVLSVERNNIQHDFTGFPKDLYDITYSCPGSPTIADQVIQLFRAKGFNAQKDGEGPLDHGVWIPLLHLFPKGDIPVVRVSLPLNFLPAQILKMGHALSHLREEGILLMASGGAVHNLRDLEWSQKGSEGKPWAREFQDWIENALQKRDVDALVTADEHPLFYQAHPSSEHYLPLLFTVGAALPGDDVSIFMKGIEYGTLSMFSFSLNSKVAHESNLH